MFQLLDGKKIAEEILEGLKKEVAEKNLKLKIAVILVGENKISEIYVGLKQKACEFVGIAFELFRFPAEIDSQVLANEIKKIVQDSINSGVIIQLPLPKTLKSQDFLNLIPAEKDIDVLSEAGIAKFYSRNSLILPPTVCAIAQLLAKNNISLEGKKVVLVGAGKLVGLPLTLWLLKNGATVSVLNSRTKDISFFTKTADIVVSGVGKPNMVTGKMIKKRAVVIDAGSSVDNGKTIGDVDFETVSKKASYIAPVPGGVGPVTVACLLGNAVELSKPH